MVSEDVNQQSALATFVDEMMEELEVKDSDVAAALGYESVRIIRMVREGKLRLPLEQIPLLADAIGVTRESLMDAAIREYFPDAVRALIMTYGHGLSDNEMAIVQLVRDVSGGSDPEPGDGGLWEKVSDTVRRATEQR